MRQISKVFAHPFFLFLSIFFITHSPIFSLEIYRIVDKSCNSQTGLIVNTDQDNIYILSIDGHFIPISREKINHILVYNTVNNPIQQISLTGTLKKYLKNIYINESESPSFTAWPIQFVEDLIVFYDLQGKTNLINLDKISSIKEVHTEKLSINISIYSKQSFSFGDYLSECKMEQAKNLVLPTRMISDKIKIKKFIESFEIGFKKLHRFQRRTKYYARPFLYEKDTKIGFNYTRKELSLEPPTMLPLYFRWSSGRPYAYQNMVSLGTTPIEWLPNSESVLNARSEQKLHFFNASIAGNLVALSAGKSYFKKNFLLFSDSFSTLSNNKVYVFPHFNYLAMTGLDYEKYSFSLGTFYPIYTIVTGGYLREVLASKSSLVTKFIYTEKKIRYKLIYSASNFSANHPNEDEIGLLSTNIQDNSEEDLISSLTYFKFKSFFIRAGFDYYLSNEIKFGLDEIFFKIDYDENFLNSENRFNYSQYTTAFYISQQFSRYVALKGYLNFIYKTYDRKLGSENEKDKNTDFSAFLSVEFLL